MKNLNRIINLPLLGSIFLLIGCKADNPGLTGIPQKQPPAIERGTVERLNDGLQVTYDTRVDILFVIDDSRSMKTYQQNLSRNIKRFVSELANVSAIDFHIGYTVAHDRGRYGTWVKPEACGGRGEPNWEPVGSLHALKGSSEKLPKDGRRFVTRDDDFEAILKDTLDPLVNTSLSKDLVNTPMKPVADGCGYGPEEEEMFSPILGLLEDPILGESTNKGFRREGALFVAIIISDAKSADVNFGLTPEVVLTRLQQNTGEFATGKRRFRVLSVVMKPGDWIGNSCKPDPAFWEIGNDGRAVFQSRRIADDENPLATLAMLAQDESSEIDPVLSICSGDYGDALARYGSQIKQDTLRDIELQIPSAWQVFTDPKNVHRNLNVFIGNTPLDRSQWKLSSQTGNGQGGVVTIYGQKIDWNKYPNEKIRVTYVPADAGASTTKPWGEVVTKTK